MNSINLSSASARIVGAAVLALAMSFGSFAAEIPQYVKDTIKTRVDSGVTKGIVVGYFDPDGVSYYSYGSTGLAGDWTPNEYTLFEIGSISKSFTGILLADMVRRGEVKLSDPIEKYLPAGASVPQYDGVSITLEDLASHRSSMPRMPANATSTDSMNPLENYTTDLLYQALAEVELSRPIGQEYEYSNFGMGLLGFLLERASGKTYQQLVVERIASPLAIPDTLIKPSKDMRQRFARGYSAAGDTVSHNRLPVLAGAGALTSTAADMVQFLKANVGAIDSPVFKAMNLSHQPRIETGQPDMQYGLGWNIASYANGREIISHGGVTEGFNAFAGFEQSSQMGVVVLTNSAGEGDNDIGLHLLNPDLPLVSRQVHTTSGETIPEELLQTYVGKYAFEVSPDTIMTIRLNNGLLSMQVEGQPEYKLYPKSAAEFFMKEAAVTVSFTSDESGTVTGLALRQGAGENLANKVE